MGDNKALPILAAIGLVLFLPLLIVLAMIAGGLSSMEAVAQDCGTTSQSKSFAWPTDKHEVVEIAAVRPDHAYFAGALEQRFGILEETRGRDQHGTVARQLGAIGGMEEDIGCDLSVLNEWHRPAP